jgi:molybdate transport system ATP-binding protein
MGGMAAEVAIDITKNFPGRTPISAALKYDLQEATALLLFGPSGSGKTTVLRSIAGLEWPERGSIRFISRTWLDTRVGIRVTPQDRQIGYMAQDYALFPTYSVAGNIAYGLGALPVAERKKRVAEMIDLFQLRGFEGAKPRELSGGQQQRVALARAVAPRPQLLLLDEPLSALDLPTRVQLRGELRTLLKHLALPSIIVTHDWAETLSLGDVMAVMREGQVLQVGPPQEVFCRPSNAAVAKIVGVETVIEGHVIEQAAGLATVHVNGTLLKGRGVYQIGSPVFVCIRGEDVVLQHGGGGISSARNHLNGKVTELSRHRFMVQVKIDCGFPVVAMVTNRAQEELQLKPGSAVVAMIKAGAVLLVPRSM